MGLQKCILNLNRANRELQPHGTPEFPIAGYAADYTHKEEDVIPWHWHAEMEILYVGSGGLKLQIPGKTFHLKQGEGFVINSNILHFAAAEPACSLHSLVFHPLLVAGSEDSVFGTRYIAPLIQCCSFDGCPFDRIPGNEISPKEEFIAAFQALSAETPGYEFVVREKLSHLIFHLYRAYEKEIDSGDSELDSDSLRMQKMLDYIENHFHENLDLSQIARAADIGARECLRCFKRVIQNSPMQYLLKYRVTQGAAMLLRSPASSVSEIAGQCGFNSSSNFSQMFGRFFQCTPREYRKRNKKAEDDG